MNDSDLELSSSCLSDPRFIFVQNIEGRDLQRGKAHAGISPFVKVYVNDFLIHRTKIAHSQSPKWDDERVEHEVESRGELTVEDFHSEIRVEVMFLALSRFLTFFQIHASHFEPAHF